MVELLFRDLLDYVFTLLKVLRNVPVLVGHTDDNVTLIGKVSVGSSHDSGSLVALLLDVNQLVIHVV